MSSEQRTAFSTYMTNLLSAGRVVFSRGEARQALGVSDGALLDAAERQQRRQHPISPRRGFYVIVPPQYLAWGAPPPPWYIDSLMRHEGRPYYVGLLKAAELHGATHHAVMEFQVVTDRQLPKIPAGRSWITFHFRKDLESVRGGIAERKTDTGTMKISSPELTALDLLRYIHVAGGVDAVATVLADLGGQIDGEKLAIMAGHFDRACVQRLGYLLDRLGHVERAEAIHSQLAATKSAQWVALEPAKRRTGTSAMTAVERNE